MSNPLFGESQNMGAIISEVAESNSYFLFGGSQRFSVTKIEIFILKLSKNFILATLWSLGTA